MTQTPSFDVGARESIRSGLINYGTVFRVGAPRIATLISEAHHRKLLVDHRRVGRFMAGDTEQPNDQFLGWCENFLRTAPQPQNPMNELARGLLALSPPDPDPILFEGIYFSGANRFSIQTVGSFATVELKLAGHSPKWADGIMVAANDSYLMFLRDRLSNAPICAILTQDLEGAIHENGTFVPVKLERLQIPEAKFASATTIVPSHLTDEYLTPEFLNIVVFNDDLSGVERLLSAGVRPEPDKFGRWPSILAAMQRVQLGICDLITDAEKTLGDV